MSGWFEAALYWHWLVLGIVLVVLEVFSPGVFFLWLGLSAGLVGGLLWLMPELAWTTQLLLFALFSVVSVVVWRLWLARHPTPSDRPTLNRRGEQYIGRRFTLEQPMHDGQGWVRVDDGRWKVAGPDLPAGTRVEVVGVDGATFQVRPAEDGKVPER